MTSRAYALARAALVRALTAYSGITSDDGAADGTTLVDSTLIGRNDFISEKTILIGSGDAKDEDKGATSFDNTDGKITLQGTGFSAQIKAGTVYRVLNISSVEIDVANIGTKIGTNTDAAGTTTLFAWMARLFAIGGQGLVYYGKVTQVDDVTHFRVAGLTGFGDAYFKNYRAYVVRDAAGLGAAPQGEMQPCSAYDSTDGIFTHTAFSVGLAVDDEVLLLHERVAEIKDLIDRLGTAADAGDLGTLFGRHLRAYLGVHTHALVVVNDASSLNADLDTALRDFLLSLGFVVTVCDHDDVAANLEISAFDLIVVSASVVTADAGDLVALRTVEVPIVCHSAEIAVSAALYMGGTAATKAAQTQIEIMDNSPMWLIDLATGNLTVTASATIYTMATKTTDAATLAEEADGTNLLTIVKLPQGGEDGGTPAYVPFFDRYFVGVADYTNMNAVFKALLDDLYMHCVMEKRFTEEAVVQVKRAYQEDIPDTDVSDTATTTESECILLDIGPLHNTRFCLRDLRVKAQADPGANTMTVKLYEYFEGALVNMDTFDIDTTNWGTYHSLMDMFGVPEVHSDAIRVACVMDAGSVAVKATYSFAEARK